jgi:pSer/pThr/pTyr-binding forkhead associated (FHA) protein
MAPAPTSLDHRPLPFESTAPLDALDRPGILGGALDAPPPPAGRHLAVEQDGERRLVALTRPITHIGRGFTATLQIEEASVSRRHAVIVQRRGRVRILDDRSANGTWVNGRRVMDAELHDGDAIALGRVVLVFHDVAD